MKNDYFKTGNGEMDLMVQSTFTHIEQYNPDLFNFMRDLAVKSCKIKPSICKLNYLLKINVILF